MTTVSTSLAESSGDVTSTGELPAPGRPASSSPATPSSSSSGSKPATAPYGSGHGLCFNLNSKLAADAIARLSPPPAGAGATWTNPSASNDSIQDGCAGVLSWMSVEWIGIHPGKHILFFADGVYLGTATAKPHAYTEVTGKTRTTVTVRYRWPKPQDPLCCPQGGPNDVTFTLSGGAVRAKGEFPPDS
ncbi:MAG: LppP/LprE family lipoprotein [Mycobacteriaceae bacterium]|nr:LppP/LprE family lipoprotein [Mycobacteriaceae bacterium]